MKNSPQRPSGRGAPSPKTRTRPADIFLCMLAFYVEHHLRRTLAPILFEETGLKRPPRPAPASSPKRSARTPPKTRTLPKKTPDELPVHSLRIPFADLGDFRPDRRDDARGHQPRLHSLHAAHAIAEPRLRSARNNPRAYPVATPRSQRIRRETRGLCSARSGSSA